MLRRAQTQPRQGAGYTAFVCLLSLASMASAFGQRGPLVFDTFDGAQLDPRWAVDSSKRATVSIEPDRHVLVLRGPEHDYNHIEMPLPEGADCVQTDVCSVNDTSASWSPSLILYWDDRNYARLMVSLFYSLRLDARVEGQQVGEVSKVALQMGEWYRAVLVLSERNISFRFGAAAGEQAEVGTVPRPASWQGQPTLIIGKGYVADLGKPDFDNNYRHDSRTKRVEYDNLVIGAPAGVALQISASAQQRVAGVAHEPAALHLAFWPNVTNPTTDGRLWLAPGVYQRLCLIYANHDTLNAARNVAVELRVPDGIEVQEVTFGAIPVEIEATKGDGVTDYTIRPRGYAVPAEFHGVGLADTEHVGWFKWPTSPQTPCFYIHCTADSAADGKVLRARAACHSGAGPWCEMGLVVTGPLPELLPATTRDLGLSLWQGMLVHDSAARDLVAARMMALCRRLGVKRIHTNKHSQSAVIAAAKANGIQPFLSSWWHYSSQNPVEFAPRDDEKASVSAPAGRNFCPVLIGRGTGTYGSFLRTITDRMRQSGCEGFMLDYECRMPLCYCPRCRQAFVEHTGVTDADWPNDVKKGGRLYRDWIDFRCHQGALYVKSIRDAARKAVADCPMQAWLAGYDYKGTIESATIDVSKAAEFLTEPETPHYTLPADYADMWTKDAGIGSVEAGIATVEATLRKVDKPIIFCSSIIYPLGSSTQWSDPRILDAQIQTIIAAGARGVSFWGGHLSGALDGRYMHKLVKWHNLLVAAGEFLWDGARDDTLAVVDDEDAHVLRRVVWTCGERYLLALINLTQEDRTVVASVQGGAMLAERLPGGESVDLSVPLVVPALDGVFLVVGKGARGLPPRTSAFTESSGTTQPARGE